MAIISGVTVQWGLSPRLIIIPTAESAVALEDLQDTLQDIEDDPQGMPFDKLRSMSGGQELDAATTVGFTMQLNNAQLIWATNVTVAESGTITTPDASGLSLVDSTALFVTNGVVVGDMVVNSTDSSHATVLSVVSETELLVDGLVGGTDDQFDSADAYSVFDWQLRSLTGGNLVAVNSSGTPITPVLNSFGNSFDRTSSSSATVSELGDVRHASFDGGVHVDVTGSQTGFAYPSGNSANPVNNFADAVIINAVEGFDQYFIEKSATLDNTQDFTDASFVGKSIIDTVLTVPSGTTIDKAEFFNVSLEGSLGQTTIMQNCFLGETNALDNVRGVIEDCSIGPAKLTLGGASTSLVRFVNCRGAGSQFSPPTINCGGNGPEVDIQDYVGQLNIENKTGTAVFEVSISGKLILDSTVTNGTIIVNGQGTLEDNSGTNAIVINNMIQGIHLQELWRLQGLEFGNPMTVTPTLRNTQNNDINLVISGDGVSSTTVTRTTDQTLALDVSLTSNLVDLSDSAATPTFTRSTTGNYYSPTTGLIVSAAIDTPRYELEGLLIESDRTNYCKQSAAVSTAPWTAFEASVTPNDTTSPKGDATGDKVIESAASGLEHFIEQVLTDATNGDWTQSYFVKAGETPTFAIKVVHVGLAPTTSNATFAVNAGVITATGTPSGIIFNHSAESVGNGWYRCSINYTLSGTVSSHRMRFQPRQQLPYDGDGVSGVYVWGGQAEKGTTATSIIETTTGTVARGGDYLSYDDDVAANLAGTVIADITTQYNSGSPNEAVIANVTNGLVGPAYLVDDTTMKIAIGDGTTVGSYDPTFVIGTTVTVATRWSGAVMQAIAGGFAGTEVTYDGSFTRTPGTLYVGSTSIGNHLNGNIKNLKIYNVDRGETQLLVDTA